MRTEESAHTKGYKQIINYHFNFSYAALPNMLFIAQYLSAIPTE